MAVPAVLTTGLLLLGVGAAVDMSEATRAKQHLQDAVDAAGFVGAARAIEGANDAKKAAEDYVRSEMADSRLKLTLVKASLKPNTKIIEIEARGDLDAFFAPFLPVDVFKLSTETRVGWYDEYPDLNIAMALDISGSMNGTTSDGRVKMEAMRDATDALFDAIDDAGIEDNQVKVGVWPYAIDLKPDHTVSLTAGTDAVESAIEAFRTYAGTNPSTAVELSYEALRDDVDAARRNNTLLYMSDGEIDDHLSSGSPNYTQRTQTACESAKAAGIRVVSVWLDNGTYSNDTLLACASPNDPSTTISDADCLSDKPACMVAKSENFFETDTSWELTAGFEAALKAPEYQGPRLLPHVADNVSVAAEG